jgi:hypothetical protein
MFINIAVKTESLTLQILFLFNEWEKSIRGVKPEESRTK